MAWHLLLFKEINITGCRILEYWMPYLLHIIFIWFDFPPSFGFLGLRGVWGGQEWCPLFPGGDLFVSIIDCMAGLLKDGLYDSLRCWRENLTGLLYNLCLLFSFHFIIYVLVKSLMIYSMSDLADGTVESIKWCLQWTVCKTESMYRIKWCL